MDVLATVHRDNVQDGSGGRVQEMSREGSLGETEGVVPGWVRLSLGVWTNQSRRLRGQIQLIQWELMCGWDRMICNGSLRSYSDPEAQGTRTRGYSTQIHYP